MSEPKRNVYVVGGDTSYANWMEANVVKTLEEADLVCFTGGADVSPAAYNKKPHPSTYASPMRDKFEMAEYKKAVELGKAIIGVCRGSQLSCVMAGGILVQDQDHSYLHLARTSDGREIVVNSTHHQRQHPFSLPADEFELLAWGVDKSGNNLSRYSFGESNDDDLSGHKDAEIVFYPKIRALGIQPHPESLFYAYDNEGWEKVFIDYCRELIDTRLGV